MTMPWLLLATLLVGTLLPTALSARDEVQQAEQCAMFQSDASNMQPDARQALKKILTTCSSDIVGSQCREAIKAFELAYGDRFVAINRGVQAWSLLEQRAKIRKQLFGRNYKDDPKLIDLRECLEKAYGARGAQSERAEAAPFDGRRAEPGASRLEEFAHEPEDKLNDMYLRNGAALEKSEERLRKVTENLEKQLSALNERTTEIGTGVRWILILVVFCAVFAVFLYFRPR
jgi:hypothetical protein